MTEQPTSSVLRQMLAQATTAPPAVPLSIARALRLSATRAAETSVGLRLTVSSVMEETFGIDDLIEQLAAEDLLLRLGRSANTIGFATMDCGLVAGIVETQTMGRLSKRAATPRPMTAVDTYLSEPLMIALLDELRNAAQGSTLEPWLIDVQSGGVFKDLRQIGLTLPSAEYRLISIEMTLGEEGREGRLTFALPIVVEPQEAQPDIESEQDWETAFAETVNLSCACLPVELHRFDLSIDVIDNLAIGQVIDLPGCRVDKARLVDGNGALVARGRLGQAGGYLALRIEAPLQEVLQDLSAPDNDSLELAGHSQEIGQLASGCSEGGQQLIDSGEG